MTIDTAERIVSGDGWAATTLAVQDGDAHRRVAVDRARGWCRLLTKGSIDYADEVLAAFHAGAPVEAPQGPGSPSGELAWVRFQGNRAYYGWVATERLLRLRGGVLRLLTEDHDQLSAARRGETEGIDPKVLPLLHLFAPIVTRKLPTHAPEEAVCSLAPGDRFFLWSWECQRTLERFAGSFEALTRRLGEGSPSDVARWIRDALDFEQPVVVIDAGATPELPPQIPSAQPAVLDVTEHDLIQRPADFHGRRVRVRGLLRRATEVSHIANAWFRGEWTHGWGTWLVDVEGRFLHTEKGRGHFEQTPSELKGIATLVDLSNPRAIPREQVGEAAPYELLTSEITVDRGLYDWFYNGQWVTYVGGFNKTPSRLPRAEIPDRCCLRATFFLTSSRGLGLVSFEILRTEPRVPERWTKGARQGTFVEIEGVLRPTNSFPILDNVLSVSPRRVLESPTEQVLAEYRAVLGEGRRVTVRGELLFERVIATSISDASGELIF
jgi:hypothetical protein